MSVQHLFTLAQFRSSSWMSIENVSESARGTGWAALLQAIREAKWQNEVLILDSDKARPLHQ